MSSTQFDSPSYLFAKRVVDTLRPQVQRQPRPESFAERCSTRIKSQLFRACKIILERTENVRTTFDEIANSLTQTQHLQLFRQYEKDFLTRLEVPYSIGWFYLFDENWEIIRNELNRLRKKGADLVSFPLTFCLEPFT